MKSKSCMPFPVIYLQEINKSDNTVWPEQKIIQCFLPSWAVCSCKYTKDSTEQGVEVRGEDNSEIIYTCWICKEMQVLVFPTSLSLSLHTHLHTRARTHKPNIRESNFGKKKSPHPKRFNYNRFHGMWQAVNNTNSSLQGIFNANASVLFIRMCVLHAVTRLRAEL